MMEIKLSLLITILFSFILTGCNLDGASNVENEVKATFVGTIEEIHDGTAIVIASESENSKLAGPVEVELSVNPNETFQVGDKVRVEYDEVMEIAPVSVSTLSIEKID